MSNDMPKESISRLSSESEPQSPESLKDSLFEKFEDENSPEAPKAEALDEKFGKEVDEAAEEEQGQESPPKNVVDKRTHSEQTTEIEDTRQSLTKEADEEEEDFIEHVEEVHSII